jgi:hypothetical protein
MFNHFELPSSSFLTSVAQPALARQFRESHQSGTPADFSISR